MVEPTRVRLSSRERGVGAWACGALCALLAANFVRWRATSVAFGATRAATAASPLLACVCAMVCRRARTVWRATVKRTAPQTRIALARTRGGLPPRRSTLRRVALRSRALQSCGAGVTLLVLSVFVGRSGWSLRRLSTALCARLQPQFLALLLFCVVRCVGARRSLATNSLL